MTRFTPDLFAASATELTAIRRDIHRHPETAFEEQRTAQIVADKLQSWGIEVHRGLATKHRLLPATYEMLDDALRRAGQVARAGGVAWLIEGDDKTRLGRGVIEQTLRKRGHELELVEQPSDRRARPPRRE